MSVVVCKVKEVELGESDYFHLGKLLGYEIKNGPFSIYKIYSYLEKRHAYKNIHQKTQKLFSLGLIEEVKGDYPHGAKCYRLSVNGWFNVIMKRLFRYDDHSDAIIKFLDKNIFFKTFLSPYFESKTIEYFLRMHIMDFIYYLIDCCESSPFLTKPADLVRRNPADTDLELDINQTRSVIIDPLEIVIKSFLIKILMNAISRYTTFPSEVTLEELSVLSDDKKFLEALENTKTDFEKSYEILTELQERKELQ